jgi:16S rRNA C1402 N4-methylase RsmH
MNIRNKGKNYKPDLTNVLKENELYKIMSNIGENENHNVAKQIESLRARQTSHDSTKGMGRHH